MGNYRKSQQLQNGAHFRVIRTMLRVLANQEQISLDEFDLENMSVFNTVGAEYRGKNVLFKNTYLHQSCYVGDNTYEIIEIPSKKNKPCSEFGKFLVLARNNSTYDSGIVADFYILTQMIVRRDKVSVYVYGKYKCKFANTRNAAFNKLLKGKDFVDGGNHLSDVYENFDALGNRAQFYKQRRDAKFTPKIRHEKFISTTPANKKVYRKKK